MVLYAIIDSNVVFKGQVEKIMKIEPVVKRETLYILISSLLLGGIMNLVFFFLKEWSFSVLLGTVLGIFASVLNFFLMALTVQKAVKKDEKEMRDFVKLSQTLRNFMLVAFAAIGVFISVFNTWAMLISLFFPRIAVFMHPLFNSKENDT